MPALSFRATPTFDLSPVPARAPSVAAPSADRKLTRDRLRVAKLLAGGKPRAKHARRVLLQGARTVLQDRFEDALVDGRIDIIDDNGHTPRLEITTGEYALLLGILFPEDFPQFAPAASPTTTAPGTAERIAAYRERSQGGESLYHAADASPTRGDLDGRLVAAGKLALAIVQRANGSGPRVVGWA